MFAKQQLLTVFLESDNVKLVASELSGDKSIRIYAGQISFPSVVVREAFIADPVKFSSQVKVALTQKPQLQTITDVQLIMPPEKTFLRTLEVNEDVESFLRVLPYFKEELILNKIDSKVAKGETSTVTYTAFEKKLVEEFQQPFLDSGKKITSVLGSPQVLSAKVGLKDDYFLLLCFEKTVAVVVHKMGKISQSESWPVDVFVIRFEEFVRNNNLTNIKKAQIIGTPVADLQQKLTTDLGLNFAPTIGEDIYDSIINSSMPKKTGFSLPSFSFGKSSEAKSASTDAAESDPKAKIIKFLPLAAAIIAGFILSFVVISSLTQKMKAGKALTSAVNPTPAVTPVVQTPTPTPVPALKPADVKVRILNGTSVSGEAGRLATKVTALGFTISETKNASTSGFVTTKLRVDSTVPTTMQTDLQTLLSGTYEKVVVEPLIDAAVKIEIIIGKKK